MNTMSRRDALKLGTNAAVSAAITPVLSAKSSQSDRSIDKIPTPVVSACKPVRETAGEASAATHESSSSLDIGAVWYAIYQRILGTYLKKSDSADWKQRGIREPHSAKELGVTRSRFGGMYG